MLLGLRGTLVAIAAGAAVLAWIGTSPTQRDGAGEPLNGGAKIAQAKQPAPLAAGGEIPPGDPKPDVREAETGHEQAQRLMKAIDAILQDAAKNRSEARKLPSDNDFILKPIWTESREDRERRVRELLDAALGVVTNVPVVDLQRKIEGLRKNIRELDGHIVRLREKQLVAPKDGVLPGLLSETADSLGKEIDEAKKRVALNRDEIKKTKADVHEALKKAGVQLTTEQVDLLLDGVLSGDLVRLVAVFNSAKVIDAQLAKLLAASGENIGAARKYFAMHATLFALLVHAQDSLIGKIDKQYLPKLSAVEVDIRAARVKTIELLRLENREDQKRALEGNRESHDARPKDCRQHVRDGGAELPAPQPDARRVRLVRGDPEARGAHLRPDLQERGVTQGVREPYAQARWAYELKQR
jgi:hypothetical protein